MASPLLRTKTPLVTVVNREHWLQNCGEIIAPHIELIAAKKMPDFLISVSMPTRKGLSTNGRVIGQCVRPLQEGKRAHLFIHPMLADIKDVAGTVAHEQVHLYELGHGRAFGAIAKPLGLKGKLTHTTAGEEFFAQTDARGRTLMARLLKLGPYPHEALDISKRAPAPTLLLKVICPKCHFVARVTQKWIDSPGLPVCQCDGKTEWVVAPRRRKAAKQKAR
jgi:hypothetical protein